MNWREGSLLKGTEQEDVFIPNDVVFEGATGAWIARVVGHLGGEPDDIFFHAVDVDGIASFGDDAHLLLEHVAEHDNADVRDTEGFGGAVHDVALDQPRELVLANDVIVLDATVLEVERAFLEGNDILLRGRLALRRNDDGIHEMARGGVVDGDAALELEPVLLAHS